MEVVWSDLAFESLYDIVEYVQGFFGKRMADEATQKIVSFVDALGNTPKLGKRIAHLAPYGEVRCAFYKMNHIYYLLHEDKVEVILVWDGRQDPNRLRSLLLEFFSRHN